MQAKDTPNEIVELDRIDHAILNILAVDGRISMTALAEKVGLSKTPVLARVRRLETEGVILNYRATLSPAKLGRSHIAFVEARLLDTREAALKAFNDAVAKVPEIEECHMIAGGYDYLLKVRTRDIAEYRRVMGEKISSLPHVSSTSTYVAMDTVKETALHGL
ncbi:Lrp/AsnC family transcriptional regulator [Roseibium aestuarii]|uniref:Lrp/AsnC family transcriptional regulator n=1 Tax=Roseibium aestuarii TaxID=2600299 RepID=A0ABW4JPK1_9HYPH|nr:Lrp/AsnC ligand binding domain-containing protein [Roseibium aestuarii]